MKKQNKTLKDVLPQKYRTPDMQKVIVHWNVCLLKKYYFKPGNDCKVLHLHFKFTFEL